MEQYIIKGGNPLVGEVEIGGAKNAALAILAAAIMTDEAVHIENLPDVRDINVLLEAIREIGATVDRIGPTEVRIVGATIGNITVEYEYIKKVPLLLLDDIGAENLTSWARDEIIGTLLQYRMDEKLPTFFTSNLDLKQLEEHFSTTNAGVDKLKARRIIERIRFLTKDFCLTSRNRRQ